MAKLTWLGEDELHTSPDGTLSAGPSFMVWGGIKFPKGEAVEVTDVRMIKKARNIRFFTVEGGPGRPSKVKPDDDEDAI